MNDLINICNILGYSLEEIQSKNRKIPLPDTRKIVSFVMYHLDYTQQEIAYMIGYEDHSTVSTNIKIVNYDKRLYGCAVDVLQNVNRKNDLQ